MAVVKIFILGFLLSFSLAQLVTLVSPAEAAEIPIAKCKKLTFVVTFDTGRGLLSDSAKSLKCESYPFPKNCKENKAYKECSKAEVDASPTETVDSWDKMKGRNGICTAEALPDDLLLGVKNCLAPVGGLPGKFMCNDHVWWWKLLVYIHSNVNKENISASSLGICNNGKGVHVLGVLCQPGSGKGKKTCSLHDNAMQANALVRYDASCNAKKNKAGKFELFTWEQNEKEPAVPPTSMLEDMQHSYCCLGLCLPKNSCLCSANNTMRDDNSGLFPALLLPTTSAEDRAEFVSAFNRLTGIKIVELNSFVNHTKSRSKITLKIEVPACACDKKCKLPVKKIGFLQPNALDGDRVLASLLDTSPSSTPSSTFMALIPTATPNVSSTPYLVVEAPKPTASPTVVSLQASALSFDSTFETSRQLKTEVLDQQMSFETSLVINMLSQPFAPLPSSDEIQIWADVLIESDVDTSFVLAETNSDLAQTGEAIQPSLADWTWVGSFGDSSFEPDLGATECSLIDIAEGGIGGPEDIDYESSDIARNIAESFSLEVEDNDIQVFPFDADSVDGFYLEEDEGPWTLEYTYLYE